MKRITALLTLAVGCSLSSAVSVSFSSSPEPVNLAALAAASVPPSPPPLSEQQQLFLAEDGFRCTAITAFAEARGEGEEGMALVVQSMLNRNAIKGWEPCTIASRHYDGFKGWPKGQRPSRVEPEAWELAKNVTMRVVLGEIDLGDCAGVTHFLNPSMLTRLPRWASPESQICQVGNHVAYAIAAI